MTNPESNKGYLFVPVYSIVNPTIFLIVFSKVLAVDFLLYAVRNECKKREYRRLNDAETDGRQMVDNLEAQNRIDKINTYCVSVPDDTKHNMYLLYCFCLSC